jgi:hypothetical protein
MELRKRSSLRKEKIQKRRLKKNSKIDDELAKVKMQLGELQGDHPQVLPT